MKITSLLSSLVLSSFLAASASAAPITYNVSRTIGVGSVSGTITTDGTFGVLGFANITDWALTLNAGDGSGAFLLDGTANSGLLVQGSSLTADADSIDFNFGGSGLVLFQNPNVGSSINFWCLEVFGCTGLGTGETVNRTGAFDASPHITLSGTQTIATVAGGTVPEPGSLALVGAVLAGLALVRRRA